MVSTVSRIHPARRERGASLIEVMVTVVIIVLGLLGLAGLHARLQTSEMESYQRSQALLLLNDMSSRMSINRAGVAAYALAAPTAAPLGAGMVCPVTVGTLTQRDVSEWCAALQGAAETTGAGANRVGAMIGGRGCIEEVEPNREYRVTVVWQGLTAVGAPPDNVTCGADAFDTADGTGVCVDDACRRYVTTLVRIANL